MAFYSILEFEYSPPSGGAPQLGFNPLLPSPQSFRLNSDSLDAFAAANQNALVYSPETPPLSLSPLTPTQPLFTNSANEWRHLNQVTEPSLDSFSIDNNPSLSFWVPSRLSCAVLPLVPYSSPHASTVFNGSASSSCVPIPDHCTQILAAPSAALLQRRNDALMETTPACCRGSMILGNADKYMDPSCCNNDSRIGERSSKRRSSNRNCKNTTSVFRTRTRTGPGTGSTIRNKKKQCDCTGSTFSDSNRLLLPICQSWPPPLLRNANRSIEPILPIYDNNNSGIVAKKTSGTVPRRTCDADSCRPVLTNSQRNSISNSRRRQSTSTSGNIKNCNLDDSGSCPRPDLAPEPLSNDRDQQETIVVSPSPNSSASDWPSIHCGSTEKSSGMMKQNPDSNLNALETLWLGLPRKKTLPNKHSDSDESTNRSIIDLIHSINNHHRSFIYRLSSSKIDKSKFSTSAPLKEFKWHISWKQLPRKKPVRQSRKSRAKPEMVLHKTSSTSLNTGLTTCLSEQVLRKQKKQSKPVWSADAVEQINKNAAAFKAKLDAILKEVLPLSPLCYCWWNESHKIPMDLLFLHESICSDQKFGTHDPNWRSDFLMDCTWEQKEKAQAAVVHPCWDDPEMMSLFPMSETKITQIKTITSRKSSLIVDLSSDDLRHNKQKACPAKIHMGCWRMKSWSADSD